MIDITALLSQSGIGQDSIRYASGCKKAKHGVTSTRGPVVAWNITKRCNFTCKHCYSSADLNPGQEELGLDEIKIRYRSNESSQGSCDPSFWRGTHDA